MVNDVFTSRITLIDGSVRGASHIRSGMPNQDSYKTAKLPEAIILAAADGHGSKSSPFSKTGSTIAVNVFCGILAQYLENYANNLDTLASFLLREGDTTVAHAIDSEWKCRVEKAHKRRALSVIRTVTDGTDNVDIWRQYGTTLLGVAITPSFYFAFQLGDGDILFLDDNGVRYPVRPEKLLGTETYSLSHSDAWKKAVATVGPCRSEATRCALMLATDGFANSYSNEASFLNACEDYYATIKEHGAEAVRKNLKGWLNETSAGGSGDDITVMFAVIEN